MFGTEYTSYSLFDAVREGRLEEVRKLIDSFGLSYSPAWSGGYVLLRTAIEKKHREIAKLLLTYGSKVNSKNRNPSNTLLHIAVKNGDIEIVEMLLDRNSNIDAKNKDGRTPLHNAIKYNKIKITELLLNWGANVNARDIHCSTPLHIAAEEGYLQIAEHLLKHGAYVNAMCTKVSTPLHLAAKKGSEEIIKLLLSSKAHANAKAKNDITPLHIAAEEGYLHIAEHLLKHGANVNAMCTKGYTPLHLAAKKGNEEIIKLLLSSKANVDANTKDKLTSLYIAAEEGHEKIIKLLLKHGANIDTQDRDGKSILHLAVDKGYVVLTEHILKYHPDINNRSNRSSLTGAVLGCGKEYSKIVESLLQYGFTVNPEEVNNCQLLHAAVAKGYFKIVEDLLKYESDVNKLCNLISERGCAPLHTASKNKQEEIARLFINYGAAVNAEDEIKNTPIFYAIENVDSEITKLLLANGANIKDRPELLFTAVQNESREIVEILLQHDADINAGDKYGRTALHFTASCEYGESEFLDYEDSDIKVMGEMREIAKLLLSKGANINAQTINGITTLHDAAQKGYLEIVEILLEFGVDIESRDKYGRTALHFTTSCEDGESEFPDYEDPDIKVKGEMKEIAKLLLSKGANINAQTINGITTLHDAAQKGYLEIVEILLEFGVDIESRDKYGRTALHFIASCEDVGFVYLFSNDHKITVRVEIVKMLLSKGANVNAQDKNGRTTLHAAAQYGCVEIVEIFLEFGADIDSRDEFGETALHSASKEGYEQIVKTLLEYGADINIMNKNNLTPLNFSMDVIASAEINQLNSSGSDDYYYDHSIIYGSHIVTEILMQHIVKMKTANLYVSKENLLLSSDDDYISDFQNFQNDCEKEIERMKSEKINNSNVSFHDILTKCISQLAICVRNETVVQVLKSDDYKTKFPIFASMIKSHFRKGIRRKELLEQGNKFLYFLSDRFPELPHNCAEKIFSYLSDKDLRIVIDVCKPTNVSSPL